MRLTSLASRTVCYFCWSKENMFCRNMAMKCERRNATRGRWWRRTLHACKIRWGTTTEDTSIFTSGHSLSLPLLKNRKPSIVTQHVPLPITTILLAAPSDRCICLNGAVSIISESQFVWRTSTGAAVFPGSGVLVFIAVDIRGFLQRSKMGTGSILWWPAANQMWPKTFHLRRQGRRMCQCYSFTIGPFSTAHCCVSWVPTSRTGV